MLLSVEQINQLLKVIETNTNIFVAKTIGSDYLTKEEKQKLAQIGINSFNLYDESSDLIKQSFHFGLISDAMKGDAQKITFEDLKKYFKSGKHIPLTEVERHSLESVKKQFLGDIKSNQGRIFNDMNGIISAKEKSNRGSYENVIRDEIKQGLVDRKTVSEIARELGKKSGDWHRNFHRIVEFVSHQALAEGRIAAIEKSGGNKVVIDVYKGACKSCVKLYLTNGIGSQPKIFLIEDLKKNGNNIGRKVAEWLPIIPPTHPYCRCHPVRYREGSVWDKDKKRFELSKYVTPINRSPIIFNVVIRGKEKQYFV